MAKPRKSSGKAKKKSAGKGKKKKGMSNKKKNVSDEDSAANLQLLKKLRDDYSANCKHFITEPLISKRLDKAVQLNEPVEKVILTNIPTKILPNDMYAITSAFNTYHPLKFICLWMINTDNRVLGALASLMAVHEGVHTLQIIDCGITSCEALATICQVSSSLRSLSLDHNPIGAQGLSHILTGVRRNKTGGEGLQKLSMKYCQIDECESLGYTLQKNSSLTELDFTGNSIKDAGLIQIANSLAINATLQVLNLAANGIAERHEAYGILTSKEMGVDNTNNQENENPQVAAMPAVANGDTPTPSLPEGLMTLCHVLSRKNVGLTVLDLRGNHFGNDASVLIAEMLMTRKQHMATTKASPLIAHVSERISEELFNKILEYNDAAVSAGGKKKR